MSRDQPLDRLVERGVGEVVGPGVVVGVGHAGVVVAEQVHRRVPDGGDAVLELLHAHLGQVGPHLGRVDRRVEDVARLATGAAHERRCARPRRRSARRCAAPFDASSSGWACTVSRLRGAPEWSTGVDTPPKIPTGHVASGPMRLAGACASHEPPQWCPCATPRPPDALVVGSRGRPARSAVVGASPVLRRRPTALPTGTGADTASSAPRSTFPWTTPRPTATQVSVAVDPGPGARPRSGASGTLVVNFGGPGDAGTETLPLAIGRFPAEIRDRFDIVSFDPRGTGGTRPIDCIDDETTDTLVPRTRRPTTGPSSQRFYAATNTAVDLDAACVARYGDWLAAVGTRNVARDLDRHPHRARRATASTSSATRTGP